MDETIERIIQKEYVMLGKVNNRGGRAACQDHFDLFRTMRASQFLVWPDFILRSYLDVCFAGGVQKSVSCAAVLFAGAP